MRMESKHNTKKGHKTTREESKRRRKKQKKNYKTAKKQSTKWQYVSTYL